MQKLQIVFYLSQIVSSIANFYTHFDIFEEDYLYSAMKGGAFWRLQILEFVKSVHTEKFSLEGSQVRVWQTHPRIYCCCNREIFCFAKTLTFEIYLQLQWDL